MSLHQDALGVLTAWVAPDAGQEQRRRRYVDHLHAHPDGLDRRCRPDHLTASTILLSADHEHVLLTLHARAGRWFQLGGHCEPGDRTLAGAALREAREESGLALAPGTHLDPDPVELDEHAVPFCGPGEVSTVHHLDVRYVAVAPRAAAASASAESLDLRWWPVGALPPDTAELRVPLDLALARVRDRGGQSPGSPGSPSSGGGSRRAAADHPSR